MTCVFVFDDCYICDVKLYKIYQTNVEDRIPLVDKKNFSKQNTYDNNIIRKVHYNIIYYITLL